MSDADRPGNTSLTWLLTVAVLVIGGVQAWRVLSEPKPISPAPVVIEESESGWRMLAEQDLGDLRQLRWWSVREERGGDERLPYDGKLTLIFSDQIRQSYPVMEGRVDVQPHRLQLVELTRSQQLGVKWKGHPTRWIPFPWLKELGAPEVLEQKVGPTATRVVVRNPSIQPVTVRIRAGWRVDKRWADDPDKGLRSAAVTDVVLPPGGTAPIELSYADGPRGGTLADPVVRPIF